MKKNLMLLVLPLLLLMGCGKSENANEHEGHEMDDTNPNQALFEKVMDMHDEVMPQMSDIYNLKKDLQEMITNSPDLVGERKRKVEALIITLDSANNAMMDWMHGFVPPEDTMEKEAARVYLEEQMEKIRGVKAAMQEAIEKAKTETEKN